MIDCAKLSQVVVDLLTHPAVVAYCLGILCVVLLFGIVCGWALACSRYHTGIVWQQDRERIARFRGITLRKQ